MRCQWAGARKAGRRVLHKRKEKINNDKDMEEGQKMTLLKGIHSEMTFLTSSKRRSYKQGDTITIENNKVSNFVSVVMQYYKLGSGGNKYEDSLCVMFQFCVFCYISIYISKNFVLIFNISYKTVH